MQIIDAHKREIHSGNIFLNTDIIRKGTSMKFIGPDLKEMCSDKLFLYPAMKEMRSGNKFLNADRVFLLSARKKYVLTLK